MAAVLYSSEQVDPVLENLRTLLASTLAHAKVATATVAERDKEIAALKAAKEPKVVLQKVAAGAPKFAFDKTIMKETLDFLEAQSILDPEHRAETILQLEDPNFALKLAARVAQISAPAHHEGRGLRKSASVEAPSTKPDPDDLAALKAAENAAWMEVATTGA